MVYGDIRVNSGAFVEPVDRRGLAHLLEHMTFESEKDDLGLSKLSVAAANLGLKLNASTSYFETKFPVSVLNSNFVDALKLVSGIVFHPKYNTKTLAKEKEIVSHEFRGCFDNLKGNRGKLFNETFFRGTPCQEMVMGKEKDLEGISLEDITSYHKQNFVANNSDFYIIGGYDNKTFRNTIKILGKMPSGKKVDEPKLILPALVGNERFEREFQGISQVYVDVLFRVPLLGEPGNDSLYVINKILNGQGKSSLWHKIRDKMHAAYSVYSYLHSDFRCAYLGASVSTTPKNLEGCIDNVIQTLKEFNPSDEEMTQAMTGIRTANAKDNDDPNNLISEFMQKQKYGFDAPAHMRRVLSTSKRDIGKVVEKTFANWHYQIAVLKPAKSNTQSPMQQNILL